MNAKPFTLSVVVAAVVGAVTLVSAQIDHQEAVAAMRPAPVVIEARNPATPTATASPLDIDPRRMEAPATESDAQTGSANPDELGAHAVKVSSAS